MAGRPIVRSIAGSSISSRIRRSPGRTTRRNIPGFFATLRGAMSDIPSSQPVTDELSWVVDFNERVRRQRAIIDSARPQVSQLVAKAITDKFDRRLDVGRTEGLARAGEFAGRASTPGFAYQAYVRLKLASVRAFGAELIVKLRGVPAQSPLSRMVAEIIDAWATRQGRRAMSAPTAGARNSRPRPRRACRGG